MIARDLRSIMHRHLLVDKDKRFTCKIAHHDRGELLKIIDMIEDAVSLEIGVDCTVEKFCEVLKEYQRDSIDLEQYRADAAAEQM